MGHLHHAAADSSLLVAIDDEDSVHLVNKDGSPNQIPNLTYWPCHFEACV